MRSHPLIRWAVSALIIGILLTAGLVTFHILYPAAVPVRPALDLSALPLSFEANVGQADAGAPFLAHLPGGLLLFAPDQVVLVLPGAGCTAAPGGCSAIDHTPRCAIRPGQTTA